jgi:hypothetical protein
MPSPTWKHGRRHGAPGCAGPSAPAPPFPTWRRGHCCRPARACSTTRSAASISRTAPLHSAARRQPGSLRPTSSRCATPGHLPGRRPQASTPAWRRTVRCSPPVSGPRIRRRPAGRVARLREAVPGGYLSVQFAAEAGDDASLDAGRGYFGSSLHGRIWRWPSRCRGGAGACSARRPGNTHPSRAREPAPLDRVADIDAAGDACWPRWARLRASQPRPAGSRRMRAGLRRVRGRPSGAAGRQRIPRPRGAAGEPAPRRKTASLSRRA